MAEGRREQLVWGMADLTRLKKLLGLLGSDHVGERAAAALKVATFIKNNDLSWDILLAKKGLLGTNQVFVHFEEPSTTYDENKVWHALAKALIASGKLSSYEAGYCQGICRVPRPSAIQVAKLNAFRKAIFG